MHISRTPTFDHIFLKKIISRFLERAKGLASAAYRQDIFVFITKLITISNLTWHAINRTNIANANKNGYSYLQNGLKVKKKGKRKDTWVIFARFVF